MYGDSPWSLSKVKERRVEVVSKSLPQFLALVSRQDVLSPKMNHFISIPCFVSREIRHGQNKRQKSKLNGTLKHLLNVRGVLGNKCAGQQKSKRVHFRETLASDNFLACSSAIRVFFCSALSITGQLGQAFM